MEAKTVNDFIEELNLISPEKRKLPLLIECPNGLAIYPSIKMKFGGDGMPLTNELEAMIITWNY